jgi:general secretion pathway protein G
VRSNAFTMLELIFVIVILGVLAAVAIPKLSATRDDAIVAKLAKMISTATSEIGAYAVANGQTTADLSVMSNAIAGMVAVNDATLDVPGRAVDVVVGTRADCVRIELVQNGVDENITVVLGAAGDARCDALHRVIDGAVLPIPIRGEQVVY